MIREEIKKIIFQALDALEIKNISEIKIEHPENEKFGDYSTNVAMHLSSRAKMKPIELAEIIKGYLESGISNKELIDKIEIVKPGFINFYLSPSLLIQEVNKILKQKNKFGDLKIGKGRKVQVEFISANPTGPLTVGNGRGGFTGDVLANILCKAGYEVEKEYYWNDAKTSTQVVGLGKSVKGEEQVYAGEYIKELPAKIEKEYKKDINDLSVEEVGGYAVGVLKKDIQNIIENKLQIKFDNWFSEQSLYDAKKEKKALNQMKKLGLIYKKDNAVWFKASEYGDTEDRVLVRSDGTPTYFLPDIAYHLDKFERGFDQVINIWGADHGGYVARLKGAMDALGYQGKLEILIAQLVRLMKGGKEMKMSKRAGTFVTLEELVDEVGLDAARFFFLMYSLNTHMDFNIDLAKEKSENNPVYYVQYAHARISSILRKAEKEDIKYQISSIKGVDLNRLNDETELNLIKELIKFPELVEDVAKNYEIHRLPYYAQNLARKFHSFYNSCQVLGDDKEITKARLVLVMATKIVLQNILDLMGVSAPEKM